ncbi:hypothetical protein CHLNCDRAFT_141441 [Chlorella variabilis]|uniref:Uncharacterized protein n=1 Tax=Chlorella variabilis TaxID=554065 RepID=E1ZSV9_CHLVA|nr:hypothetical protein CHLNCDRAFT_141441 [Chlorella variabilis]EFN51073.1 hypothetical protein CHLNCDRAFT_141441 [Chlorella variabilis]|eukprot:XP_005843175.1 hypothetical protein CHLNCDRAFT_141441 [Chlorella variabilis]
MRPAARFSSRAGAYGVEKPLRAAQACTKAAEATKLRPAHAAQLDGDNLCASLSSVLSPCCQTPTATASRPAPPPAAELAPEAREQLHALLDAGRLLGRLLDGLARALAGRQALPSHVEALLARLFPSARTISVTLPSADGQGLAVTTLLHACQPAAQSGGAAHHSEPLGRGVCSFHLSVPPSGASLRLMRALMHQLAARLRLEAAEGAAAATAATPACRPPMARGAAAAPRPAYAAPAPSGALGHSMPADCFWMSM